MVTILSQSRKSLLKSPTLHPVGGNCTTKSLINWPSEPSANPWRSLTYAADRPRQFPCHGWNHSAPLMTIQERDWSEMNKYFEHQDMTELEADITGLLNRLVPEPIWEDEISAFAP
jgi:hypothetical protein